MRVRLVITLFGIWFSVCHPLVYAQQTYLTISGKLSDADSGEPLQFASIGIQGTSIGTVSNLDGEFDLHFPSTYRGDTIYISMLGYEPYGVLVSGLLEEEIDFKLSRATTFLDEVLILDSLSGGDIMRIALGRIEENYPMQPYSMDGFYRDLKKVNNNYVSLLEAALVIYDKDYSEPRNPYNLRERVGLREVRKSLNYEYAYRKYFDSYNLLEELLLENNVKYRTFSGDQQFFENIAREGVTNIGGNIVFKLALYGDNNFSLVVYVNTDTYAIHRLEYEYGGDWPLEEIKRSGKLTERLLKINKRIEFEEFQNRLYLKYLTSVHQSEWVNSRTNEVEVQTELFQELLINEIEIRDPEWITSSAKMKRYGLEYQDMPYNKQFWDNYNVIKDTPLDKKIVADLEEYGELSSQFENY